MLQNQRTVRVGRDFCGSPSPTPCRSRVTQTRLHRTFSRQVLNISREGDSTTSLGNTTGFVQLHFMSYHPLSGSTDPFINIVFA